MRPTGPVAGNLGRVSAALVALTAVLVLSAASARPAGAVPGPAADLPLPSSDPNIAAISPALDTVVVDGPDYRVAKRAYDDVASRLQAATAARVGAEQKLAALHTQDDQLTQQVATETARKKQVQVLLTQIRASLRAFAVATYMQGTEPEPDDIDAATAVLARQTEVASISRSQVARAQQLDRNLRDVLAQLNTHVLTRAQVRNDIATTQAAQASSAADEAQLTTELQARSTDLAQARAHSNVVGYDFSLLALDAYYRAAVEASQSLRRCGIQWWAIAAITRTESHHGTYGGARLLGNGDTDPHIVGITLDGTNDTAVIPDTDDGAFDGDPDYDHAVGPMQFIPSTWKRWKADGNGDGVADPNNIYDATEAAAHYLCATGPMESDDDLLRGYFSYNHSDDYAQAVLANSQLYRQYAIPPVPSGA